MAASLARRMRTWSGNFLATCVILILGLAFGRQVIHWWRDDPAGTAASRLSVGPDVGPLADPAVAHQLAFGDLPLIVRRSVFVGDEQAALGQLREQCRQALRQGAPLPPQPARRAGQSLLERLEGVPAVQRGPGWRILQQGGPVILVVALQSRPASAAEAEGSTSGNGESVVSWGLGLRQLDTSNDEPARSDRWTLLTCSGGQLGANSGRISLPSIPPGSRRTLAMRVEQGGALVGFEGQGSPRAWRRYFDQAFAERGGTRRGAWQQLANGWYARFQQPDESLCEVQLSERDDGTLSGMLTIEPARPGSEN